MLRTFLLSAMSTACLLAAAPQPNSLKHPLVFEPNRGQFPQYVKWIARGANYQLILTSEGATFKLLQGVSEAAPGQPAAVLTPSYSKVQMKLSGSRPWATIRGLDPTGGVTNYFLGNNPRDWQSGIQNYARVSILGVYEGIDLVFYSNGRDLEYDFEVEPGADPNRIRLAFDGLQGMQVDGKSGDLVLTTPGGGQLRHGQPKVYQQAGTKKIEIAGSYRIIDRRQAAFTLAAYDPERPLVIDPDVRYLKNLKGFSGKDFRDIATDIAVDGLGNAWTTGYSFSDYLSVQTVVGNTSGDGGGAGRRCRDHRTSPQAPDVFVTKMAPDGALLATTFIGWCGFDLGHSIAVDASGAYITGYTESARFPQVNPFQTFRGPDAFVLKLDPTGQTILYSSFLGGPSTDIGRAIAVDSSGNAYVVGKTYTSGFPTVGPMQPNFGGVRDGFIAKVNPTGTGLVYSTYLGGSDEDDAAGVAVDYLGQAYVTGQTFSNNFPARGASQFYPNGPSAFVTKLNGQGNTIIFSTYLGGGADFGTDVAVATVNFSTNVYVTGATASAAFPTTFGAIQTSKPSPAGSNTAFLTKFSTGGNRLFSTYFGGPDGDTIGRDVAVNGFGEVYIGGTTTASSLPGWLWTPDILGHVAGFVTKLSHQFDQLRYTVGIGSEVTGLWVSRVSGDSRSLPPPVDVYAAGWVFKLGTDPHKADGFVIRMTEVLGQ